jgi:hypothetical protein
LRKGAKVRERGGAGEVGEAVAAEIGEEIGV